LSSHIPLALSLSFVISGSPFPGGEDLQALLGLISNRFCKHLTFLFAIEGKNYESGSFDVILFFIVIFIFIVSISLPRGFFFSDSVN
jgi:hypothetical protein